MANDDESFESMFRRMTGRAPRPQDIKIAIDQSVRSYNQSGGITAHTVNFSPPKRQLMAAEKNELLSILPRDRVISVEAPIGDIEAINHAQEVWDFLQASGYRMAPDGLCQSIRIPAAMGQAIEMLPGGPDARIVIGHQQS